LKRSTGLVVASALIAAAALRPVAVHAQHQQGSKPVPGAGDPTLAIAVLTPTAGSSCHGIIRFAATGLGLKVTADVEGLKPGQQHAIHVHEFGDCSAPDATSAGSHYNPESHPHGLPSTAERHAGDLGNLTADAQGKAHYEIEITNASIAGPKNPILGRSVIVHEKLDDGGQPVGNAGARLACGVVGLAKPPAPAK
jgi:Cu-Zn family superoxide dismutase